MKQEDIERCKELVASKMCSTTLVKDVENLYVVAVLTAGEHSASVSVVNRHTFITRIERDGEVIFTNDIAATEQRKEVNARSILAFADEVDIEDVRHIISVR